MYIYLVQPQGSLGLTYETQVVGLSHPTGRWKIREQGTWGGEHIK